MEVIAPQQPGFAVVRRAVDAEVKDQRILRLGAEGLQPGGQRGNAFRSLRVGQYDGLVGPRQGGQTLDVLDGKPQRRHGQHAVVDRRQADEIDRRVKEPPPQGAGQQTQQRQPRERPEEQPERPKLPGHVRR